MIKVVYIAPTETEKWLQQTVRVNFFYVCCTEQNDPTPQGSFCMLVLLTGSR